MNRDLDDTKSENEASSDGRAAVAILLLTVVVIAFVISRVV